MYGKIPVNARKVRCIEKGIVFNSLREAGDWLGELLGEYTDKNKRCRICDRIGEHLKKGNSECKGYHWEYIES